MSRTGTNSPQTEQELFLHLEKKKKALAVPGFHLEHEIFPLVSYKLHHGEYISPNRRAGEDLTSCLAHRHLLDPGLHQSDMSLS